jgi:hypothetical protein
MSQELGPEDPGYWEQDPTEEERVDNLIICIEMMSTYVNILLDKTINPI